MSAVVADTHAIVWYLSKPEKLSATALQTLDQASQSGQMIYLSAISIVELQYLTERNRIDIAVLNQILKIVRSEIPSIEIVALDLEIGENLALIDRAVVPEMPDRIIAATALSLKLPLVTCDHKIQACTAIQTIW
jgi:PIN domain nuclease of toxin-antitoxin system